MVLYPEMTELLLAKDYFGLEKALKDRDSQLSEVDKLYFRAHVESAINQTEQSLQTIDLLFSAHKKSLRNVIIYNLLILKHSNHIRQFEYKQAIETWYDVLAMLESYNILDSEKQEALIKQMQGYKLLKNIPPQKIFHATDAIIPVNKTEFGHLTMQVICNGVTEEFVFDTGFNYSAISESVASRMGIQSLDGSTQVSASTGKLVDATMGVADSLRIGDLLFENVVFNIFPDEKLTWTEYNYSLRGIIGLNLINQMKEIRIDHQAGNIVVPQTPVKRSLRNLFLGDGRPVVRLESGQDTLLFALDTGAAQSEFYNKYFDAHRERIVEKGQHLITTSYGIGGGVLTEKYELTDVPFKIDNFQMTLPKIRVSTQKIPNLLNYDGVLGQDVLMHFDKMILNFESMYLTFGETLNNSPVNR